MTTLIKIGLFIKKYWYLFLLVSGAIAAFFVTRKSDESFAKRVEKINSSHREEIQKINDARALEREEKEKNEKAFKSALAAIKNQYDNDKKTLSKKNVSFLIESH